MQTFGEIFRLNDPAYMRYLARKTQYVVTRHKNEFILRFWEHLVLEHHPAAILPELSGTEHRTLCLLLQHFCHDARDSASARYAKLEKRVPWVLEHPEGGYFIPYEILKMLMYRHKLLPPHFLFHLLSFMPEKEIHSLRALLAHSHRSREAMGREESPRDQALSLYIWTAQHKDMQKIKLASRNSERSVWQHLLRVFPKLSEEIAEWERIMVYGRKGFYRALSLIPGAEILKLYVTTLRIVPLFERFARKEAVHQLTYAVPLEFKSEGQMPRWKIS